MRSWPEALRRSEGLGPTLVFAGLFLLVVMLKGGHFSLFDLRTLCINALPLVLVGLGQYFIILTRGIDLSLGPVMSVAGTVAAVLFPYGAVPALLLAGASGLVAGACNGALVTAFDLPPVIVTLATMSIWDGVALVILPNPGGNIPPGLQMALTDSDLLVPVPLILVLLCAAVTFWVMRTPFGLHLRAIGGEEAAAATSGVRTGRTKLAAYALGGLLAAFGGIYLTVSTSAGSPTIGDSFILTSIAAVVLGGVPLIGGRGSPWGVLMGALILTIVGSLLYFANLSSFYQSLINGVILIAVVGIGTARSWLWGVLAR